jgi:hypothetical protein
VAVVGEGCVADAERVIIAEVGNGVSDLMKTFDGERRNELFGVEVREGSGAIRRWREAVWVESAEAVEKVNLVVCPCNA